MATRINTKFVLLLGIAVFTAAGVVGGLWFLQIRGDTGRHLKAGDAMMAEARALEAAGDDVGASVIFEKALNEYGRAVSKEPADLGHLRKVEEALLSLRPMSRDQANEFEPLGDRQEEPPAATKDRQRRTQYLAPASALAKRRR